MLANMLSDKMKIPFWKSCLIISILSIIERASQSTFYATIVVNVNDIYLFRITIFKENMTFLKNLLYILI